MIHVEKQRKLSNSYVSRIILMWYDKRFRNSNLTTEEAKMCYPGLVRQEQVEELWKPDIYFQGTMNGVTMKIIR